jgi:hypothetical protein
VRQISKTIFSSKWLGAKAAIGANCAVEHKTKSHQIIKQDVIKTLHESTCEKNHFNFDLLCKAYDCEKTAISRVSWVFQIKL